MSHIFKYGFLGERNDYCGNRTFKIKSDLPEEMLELK